MFALFIGHVIVTKQVRGHYNVTTPRASVRVKHIPQERNVTNVSTEHSLWRNPILVDVYRASVSTEVASVLLKVDTS